MNYPEGFTSYDRDYVDGVQYAPDAPASEVARWGDDETIYFDYTVVPLKGGDVEVVVEIAGFRYGVLDFEHTRTFEDVESAQDWVYEILGLEATYEQAKAEVRRG
jgi:hypothetical protein